MLLSLFIAGAIDTAGFLQHGDNIQNLAKTGID